MFYYSFLQIFRNSIYPTETLQLLIKNSDIKLFKAGEVIFKEGDQGNLMYGIIEGEVELALDSPVVETITQGDVFGVGALLHNDLLRTSSATAKIDSQIAVVDREHFLFAVQETPMFALEVMKSYSDRCRRLRRVLV